MLIIVILRELNEIKEQFFRKLKTFDLFFIKFVVKMNIHKFIDTFFHRNAIKRYCLLFNLVSLSFISAFDAAAMFIACLIKMNMKLMR